MSPNMHTVSSPLSTTAPNTPRKLNGSMPKPSLLAGTPASRRKASEADLDDPVASQKRLKKNADMRRASAIALTEEDYDVPYAIEVPAIKAPRKNESPEEVFRDRDGASLGLEVEYAIRERPVKTIRPVEPWVNMKSYKTVKFDDLSFTRGDFAYFAQSTDLPEEYTDEEILESNDPLRSEREHFYIGMIADARAVNPQNVYLRVLYAYWPEELPQGRQSYHGMKEVIMSNHMDILDAHTIAGKVFIQQLDESVEDLDGVYWRQTLDITKFDKAKKKNQAPGVLSTLTGHCRCGNPMNPDKILYICRRCKLWNHEECLVDAVLERAWEKHKEGTLGEEYDGDTLQDNEESDSIEVASDPKKQSPVITLAGKVGEFASKLMGGSPTPTTNGTSVKTEIKHESPDLKDVQVDGALEEKRKKKSAAKPQAKNKYRMPGDPAPWDRKFNATIDTTGKAGNTGVVMAKVMDQDTNKAVCTMAVLCLGCKNRLD